MQLILFAFFLPFYLSLPLVLTYSTIYSNHVHFPAPLLRIEKRAKYSRRRPFGQGNDVDYINERNMKFNKKAARYYDKYTAEIKQNLERGTAV